MYEETEYRIKRVQAGETQEYVYIVQKYQKQIFMYCWRLISNKQEAEDAVQDVLVKAYEKIDAYKPEVNFSAWLYKIAYHHCINIIRRKKMQQKWKFRLMAQDQTAISPAEMLDNQLFNEPLSRALEKLNVVERNLLILRVFEEKSFVEIAEILNKSPDAVKKKFARTKIKLKKWMKPKEEELCQNYNVLLKTKI
ncbi:RNA polymerase subunit sigma [Paenibacillus amylolyticus]|uniref:RNA polymerase sigma factor n=1 Tax=Paenibacillus TaxID=44249 RepID=UPI00096E93C4|nr:MULTISPECIES: sigma-70 family RNA polymerase sigma factor [Paenibacillus]MCP1427221.1 RNA polymerase sigma-70 factor (ECF subfamily) [Paenibacillus xylanexedens]OMF01612.1 RNA polymerase subunit sigma [Paenibacillus amylolyticus]WFA86751.1 sigma-70 family RNA polymerase sigma factor [Paenibacillus amylolyticus]